ncbi:MAG: hypothetical protein KAI74_02080 [Kiritimatiellae bacterium]|nr:hypothetical protein [Kiritimatiellia bacterium]
MNKYIRSLLAVLTLSLISSGCSSMGYRLGTTLPKGLESVRVPIFINKTKEPLLETATTQATIQEFQREGTMKIVKNSADTLLEVILTDFVLEPVRYSQNESLTGQEYRIRIYADMVFSKTLPEKTVMIEKRVIGEATFILTTDLSSGKLSALPAAADNLGYHIVNNIVEYW